MQCMFYWYLAVLGNITCKYSLYMFVYYSHINVYLIVVSLSWRSTTVHTWIVIEAPEAPQSCRWRNFWRTSCANGADGPKRPLRFWPLELCIDWISQLSCWSPNAECIFVYFCHIFVIMQELHSFSCVQATELDHELRNALAERGRATTALHVLTTMQRHNVRISFCFSCEWCDGVMCGRTLCNDIDIKLFEAYFFVQSHFKLAYNCSFHDLRMEDKASPGQVLIFILQSFPFL